MTARQLANPTPSKTMSHRERQEAVTIVGVIRRGGLWVCSSWYQSVELHALHARMGSVDVMVAYFPSRLDFLYVLDAFTKTTLKVPRAGNGRRNVSLGEHPRTVRQNSQSWGVRTSRTELVDLLCDADERGHRR